MPTLLISGCANLLPDDHDAVAMNGASPSALLVEARNVSEAQGLPTARDLVAKRLTEIDESEGELERRIIETTRDEALVLPDSLTSMSPPERQRVAWIFVPGTKTGFGGPSNTRACLGSAAKKCAELGFSAHFIDTPPRGEVTKNGSFLAKQITPIVDEVDHVVLVALSKGAHDLIDYLQEHALELSAERRAKFDVVISLVGTVQGSVVANYLSNSPRLVPVATRLFLSMKRQSTDIDMLRSVAALPWRTDTSDRMKAAFPNLTWISAVMLPDGEDGCITEKLWSPLIRNRIRENSPYFSPTDGLVESAASVLPDEVQLTEWIIRSYGSHSMPNGNYPDGSPVAPRTAVPGDEELKPESGGEVLSAYLRALPRSLLETNVEEIAER